MTATSEPARPVGQLRLASAVGKWTLFAAALGSGLAFLDATVVNVALPRLGESLNASVAGLQWTVNAYTVTLAAFILLGGSLGDRYGRRRIFVIGAIGFAVSSLLCGLSPSIGALIAARLLQGVFGALLTPGSLALIQASFHPDDRGRAVGAWSGLTGIATAIGPFIGGWLVESAGWRWVFFINLPLALIVVAIAKRHVPESSTPGVSGRFDIGGAILAAVGLGGLTYLLITVASTVSVGVIGAGVVGISALVGFFAVESRVPNPMVQLGLFRSQQFSAVNIVTVWVYAGLGLVFFFVVLQLQVVAGYSPIAAGTALLPVTFAMLILSSRMGGLAQRIGPKTPMTLGTILAGIGILLLSRIGSVSSYVGSVLPGAILLGIGLAMTVAPLTAAVLSAVDSGHAGVASGVNNAVARAGGLLSVAIVPAAVGLTGNAYRVPHLFNHGYQLALYSAAGLMFLGAVLSWTIVSGRPCLPLSRGSYCSTTSPPLQARETEPAHHS